ncbi:MAG TPA: cupin domain-containing protein [Stellaceae bacterium]|jgi:quercetin dioxygenase-like cupin family protein|nr:cupin domain-containing protein [Stellaceae bacterium]
MTFRVRRVVTTRNAGGKSAVASDALVDSVAGRFDERVGRCDPWRTDERTPRLDGPDPMTVTPTVTPSPGGTIFRILEIPPGNDTTKHKTATLDYYVILEGELYMTLDEGEVLCKAGDVIVQRSTNHGWDNRSGKPARFAEVLIDARGS